MYNYPAILRFEWDPRKERENLCKHRIGFREAIEIFADPRVIHLEDERHSSDEDWFYAVGRTFKGAIVTVRYTVRGCAIRIFGAARWRKWRRYYERQSSRSD